MMVAPPVERSVKLRGGHPETVNDNIGRWATTTRIQIIKIKTILSIADSKTSSKINHVRKPIC